MIFREANISDLSALKQLAIKSWSKFKTYLTEDNWIKLFERLNSDETYLELLDKSTSVICENENNLLIGMAFLVPRGNPTEIFEENWSYIRFVTVSPDFQGRGVGRQLTMKCIEVAITNKETTIALHTSELMLNARHLYQSLGFEIVKEIDSRLGKRYWLYKMDL